MVDNIERRGVIRDVDVIKVCTEGGIYIENYKLSVPYNFPVVDKEAAVMSIFDDWFGHNGL